MPPKPILLHLTALMLFSCGASHAAIAPSDLSVQYGDNFEDQDQLFLDIELSLSDVGYINLGTGRSHQVIAGTTLTTDYYNFGFTRGGDSNIGFSLDYNHWELNRFSTDSYTADLTYYVGNWNIGLHPELHRITYTSLVRTNAPFVRRTYTFDNIGGGISVGYFAGDHIFLYADFYRYDFSANQPPPRDQLRISPLQHQVISSFDEKSNSISADYYFDQASVGAEYQQGTTAIYGDEYRVSAINSSFSIGKNWYAGISISHTHGSSDEFYNLNIGYDWK